MHVNMNHEQNRGIIIYIKESMAHATVQLNVEMFQEACIIEIMLKDNDILLFCCVYRSPTETVNSSENNEKLNLLLKSLSDNKKYTHKCIIGDFNFKSINWSNWSSSLNEESKEERFLNTIRDCYLHQNIEEPTRSRGDDEPSLIDLLFTDEATQISDLKYLAPLGKSDHCILSFKYICYSPDVNKCKRFLYNKANYEMMKNDLNNHDWKDCLSELKPIEDSWKEFKDILLNLRDGYVPKSKDTTPPEERKGEIPLKKSVRDLIKQKSKLHRRWISLRSARSSPQLISESRQKYNIVRNKVKNEVMREKRNYEKRICERSKDNPKVFWKHVRSKMKSKDLIAPLLANPNDGDSLKYTDSEKAEILQKQFISAFTHEPSGDLPPFPERCAQTLSTRITEEMVMKEINELDENKSIGPDEIHAKMLKELKEYIVTPLTAIMNKSLKQGSLPLDWKLAHITPIFKKGAKNLAINYRPVSLTSIVCKLMERVIKKQAVKHLLVNDLISPKQYGFVKGRSTTTQLLAYLDSCAEFVSKGQVVYTI